MIIAKIQVNGMCARAVYRKSIPAGIIGAQVEFDYAADIWQGLHKTVVFNGAVTKDVVTDANLVTIPAETVSVPRITLRVGVYGVDADGNLAIPTLWADLGSICDSANPSGDTSTDPSLPVWAQLQAMIGDLDKLDTTAKENLVAAINEAMTKGGGAASFETDNTLILADGILRVNTTDIAEKDNTLPITSAGVDTIVGNIGAILDTI